MIIVKEKLGNINTTAIGICEIETLVIEWHETKKRILHKQTNKGNEVVIKFLNENPNLADGDILWKGENIIIAVEIKPCECIVINPGDVITASAICYEIGNRHLPLFYDKDELLIPFEMPLYNLLAASGYKIKVEERKLSNAFSTTILPHLQVADPDSLISKIIQVSTLS